jgi:hypothetical protein
MMEATEKSHIFQVLFTGSIPQKSLLPLQLDAHARSFIITGEERLLLGVLALLLMLAA